MDSYRISDAARETGLSASAPRFYEQPFAALAAAEQQCCAFLAFSISIDPAGVSLEVTGPPEARDVIAAFAAA